MEARQQTLGEEIANSISHGLGFIAALAAAPFLLMAATRHGDIGNVIGAIVFSATMLLVYFVSSIYHGWPASRVKRVFEKLDYVSIYLFIAGTYTPFTIGVLRSTLGWIVLGLVWALAATGIALMVFERIKHPLVSTGLYLGMGWLILIALPLLARLPPLGLGFLIAGGVAYTLGVVFFVLDSRVRYGHFIWHLFVICGTACHGVAVYACS